MINLLRVLSLLCILILSNSCENSFEPGKDSFSGFWNATEVAQHFWLDDLGDSLAGFGQIGIANTSGYIQWIDATVSGNLSGDQVSLIFMNDNITSSFSGTATDKNNLSGKWIILGDTLDVNYTKRIRN
ncbi:MAG: hypothetical protein R3321_10265 [Nitrososphaeraceae archaeon]|nr:hypothetical protein [Nitrososphaeraceae archaeon]